MLLRINHIDPETFEENAQHVKCLQVDSCKDVFYLFPKHRVRDFPVYNFPDRYVFVDQEVYKNRIPESILSAIRSTNYN